MSTGSRTPMRFRLIRRIIWLYVVVPYLSVILIFTLFQRKLLYRPTVARDLAAATLRFDPTRFHDVTLKVADQVTLRGWLLKQSTSDADQPGPLVLYFPGNSLNRFERLEDLREVAAAGFDVLIFDYRGFGDSSGAPSEQALSDDAKSIWKYACEELHYSEHQIVVLGESLGGAVALSLWSGHDTIAPQPAALILSSTFASVPKTVSWHYPFFPFDCLVWDRWPSIDRISRVSVPIVIYHGTADRMVPIEQGRNLASAAGPTAQFVEIPGGEHNDLPTDRLRAELCRRLTAIQGQAE